MSEAILRRLNPYVLAAYMSSSDNKLEIRRAITIVQELIDNSNKSSHNEPYIPRLFDKLTSRRNHLLAADYNLLGFLLEAAERPVQATSSYQRAIEVTMTKERLKRSSPISKRPEVSIPRTPRHITTGALSCWMKTSNTRSPNFGRPMI
jgi:hypothetical protein